MRVGSKIKNKLSGSSGVVIDMFPRQGKIRFRLDTNGYAYLVTFAKFIRLYEEASNDMVS